jgi:hypothetical protein
VRAPSIAAVSPDSPRSGDSNSGARTNERRVHTVSGSRRQRQLERQVRHPPHKHVDADEVGADYHQHEQIHEPETPDHPTERDRADREHDVPLEAERGDGGGKYEGPYRGEDHRRRGTPGRCSEIHSGLNQA